MTRSDYVIEAHRLVREFALSQPRMEFALRRQTRQTIKAVNNVSFAIRRGETFALVGESGSGKSTVARILCGLLAPTSGSVLIDGIDLKASPAAARARQRRQIQMIFQDPYSSLNPRWRIRDIVAEPMHALGLVRGRAERSARVKELLTQVGLAPEDADKYPHEFSGGQR